MSGFTLINVGAAANDGTGDSLRVSQQAVNSNYSSTVRTLAATSDLATETAATGYVRIVYTGIRAGVYVATETEDTPNGITQYASATVGWIWVLQNFLDAARVVATTAALANEAASSGNVIIVTGSTRPGVYVAEVSATAVNGYNTFSSATSGTVWRAISIQDYSIHGQIDSPVGGDYVLALRFNSRAVIESLSVQTAAGTLNCAVKIDGVAVTGISSVSASSEVAASTATDLNLIAENSKITLTLSVVSDVASLFFSLKIK
jgi:hypothetical protein